MNTIRFISNDKIEKQFVVSLWKNMNDYFKNVQISTKANIAMVIKTITLVSIYLVLYVLILTVSMITYKIIL